MLIDIKGNSEHHMQKHELEGMRDKSTGEKERDRRKLLDIHWQGRACKNHKHEPCDSP